MIPLGILGNRRGGAAAGAYELISTTVLGSSQASVTFTSGGAWSTYKHLQLRMTTRGTNSATNTSLLLRFNGDTANNYVPHWLAGDGSSVYSGAGAAQAFGYVGQSASATTTANAFGAQVVDILDFASTTKNKTIRNSHGIASNYNNAGLHSNLWMNTASMTSVQVYFVSGNLDSGSRFSLYGIRG